MLEKADLKVKCSKEEYENIEEGLLERIGCLQRRLREKGIPVIILFDGWHASLRGRVISSVLAGLDPRGFRVRSAAKKNACTEGLPYLTRFWTELPAQGSIAIYNNSWYYGLFEDKADSAKKSEGAELKVHAEDVNVFEKQLADGGYLLIKIFLHISQERQEKNLEKLEKTYGKDWHKIDGNHVKEKEYELRYEIYDETIEATDKRKAKWHVIPAEDLQVAQREAFGVICREIETALKDERTDENHRLQEDAKKVPDVLSGFDLSLNVSKDEYKEELKEYQKKLQKLQFQLAKKDIAAIIAFEGWDASGKGGAIRRLTSLLDPVGYRVVPIGKPTETELQHHYLWRFWQAMPFPGEITIFDRTWYGRVLVERVESLVKEQEWRRAYREINETEELWRREGIVLIKFWLQIDKEQQMARFRDRENTPSKTWKITEEDWRNRSRWEEYEKAVNEMLFRTSTDVAPWVVVEANDKYHARLKVLKTVADEFERALAKP